MTQGVSQGLDHYVALIIGQIEQKLQACEDKSQAESALDKCISEAFKSVGDDQRQAFYKKLSLVLHPDKIAQFSSDTGSNPPQQDNQCARIYRKLIALDCSDLAQQVLEKHYRENPSITHAFFQAANDPTQLTAFVTKLIERLEYMLMAYERYFQPIRSLVNITSWLINIGLIVSLIGLGIPVIADFLLVAAFNFINSKLINLLTDGKLADEQKNATPGEKKFAQSFAQQLKALGKSIIRPLPSEGFWSRLGSVISRPFQVILSIPLAVLSLTQFLVDSIGLAFLMSAIAVPLVVKLASLAVLHAPLFIIDFTRYIANSLFKESKIPPSTAADVSAGKTSEDFSPDQSHPTSKSATADFYREILANPGLAREVMAALDRAEAEINASKSPLPNPLPQGGEGIRSDESSASVTDTGIAADPNGNGEKGDSASKCRFFRASSTDATPPSSAATADTTFADTTPTATTPAHGM